MLTLPSIDYITKNVWELGKGSLIYKIDISRAFRHIKIDLADYNLLGLHFNSYYIDIGLPFGFIHRSAIFQRLSDAIRYMMSKKGFQVTNYIDDIIVQANPSQADKSSEALYSLLGELGLYVTVKKLIHLTTRASCLGVIKDTTQFTISVPEEKLGKFRRNATDGCLKQFVLGGTFNLCWADYYISSGASIPSGLFSIVCLIPSG